MGCEYSKLKNRNQRKAKDKEVDDQLENDYCAVSEAALIEKQDQETINIIKKDLNETPELFVLNNVLMSTMFLRNYQEEILEVFQHIETSHDSFWEPDIIMEKANQNVVYRPMHGPKKNIAEPLVTRRIYVPMNEYVDVYSPLDDAEDETESKTSNKYRVKIEESKRQGYVKLQRLNDNSHHDSNSMKDVLVVTSSNTSGSSDTESTSTSIEIQIRENPQLIKDQTDQGTLEDCFVYRKVKKPDIDLEMEDMDHKNLTEEDIYDIVSYLPSRKFMKCFQGQVFKSSIAQQLGFVQHEIDQAIVDEHIPGKIFCNLSDNNGNFYPAEVLPCLKCSWPTKPTYEFLERKQTKAEDGDAFQWPTEEMRGNMKYLQCALVPKGYSRKRGIYPEGDLEWEINFPLAESYLETLLRPGQIKCYLILLTLFKEYLEPFTKSHGIVPEHFLNHIFWESEKDYHSWPEHRIGIKLMIIIQNFSNILSQRSLRDYFIRKKNVLKNISRKYLEHANEVFHRIRQSPVMFIIRALRNVRYTSGKFYPPLDYKELLDILYKKDWDETPVIDSLTLNSYSSDNTSVSTTSLDMKPKFADAEKQLAWVKERERKKMLLKKRESKNNIRNVANLTYNVTTEARRGSCDSVNDDWECEKRFDRQKKIALLKLFINSYIDIARTSLKIGSKKQTLFYLKQAWYLTKLLEQENQLFAEEVTEFFVIIKEEEDKVNKTMQTNRSTYGNLNVVNNNHIDKEHELLEDLISDAIGVEAISITISEQVNDEYDDIHRQIGQTKVNLGTLCRSFSINNYSQPESNEVFR